MVQVKELRFCLFVQVTCAQSLYLKHCIEFFFDFLYLEYGPLQIKHNVYIPLYSVSSVE